MTSWICATCAVEYPDSPQPPERCPICSDERQYVRPTGQRWTTLADLEGRGHRGSVAEVEPGLLGIEIEPSVGIGQRALLVQTPGGNLLWDSTGYVDDDLVGAVSAAGGVAVIAASHPHMFGVQVEWSHRFQGAPVYVTEADQEWVQRNDPAVRLWDEPVEVLPGVTLHRIGGHSPVVRSRTWSAPTGRACCSAATPSPARRTSTGCRSCAAIPNKLPMSAAVIEKVASRVLALEFDRLYDNFGGQVLADAQTWVRRSADRYIAWVRGDFDHLTG